MRLITDSADLAYDQAQHVPLYENGIEAVEGVAEALVGEPHALQGVRLTDGGLVRGTQVFFSYAHHPTNTLAKNLGCELDDDGQILINSFHLTSVDGVYAAGDITPGLQLVPIAIGQGTAAGIACATSLRSHNTIGDAPPPAPPTHRFTSK